MSGAFTAARPVAWDRPAASRSAGEVPVGRAYFGPRQARRAVLKAHRRRLIAQRVAWTGLAMFVLSVGLLVLLLR
jgi:hypothetical protein